MSAEAIKALVWLYIIIQIVIVITTIKKATSKGYSGWSAFFLCLFIPLLGSFIIVSMLPDKNETLSSSPKKEVSQVDGEKTTTQNVDGWVCKKCGKTNNTTALFCSSCGENNPKNWT